MYKLELILIPMILVVSCFVWSQEQKEFVCNSKNQQCGVRSPEGDTIIPFSFQSISRVSDSFYITHHKIDSGRKEVFKMCIFDLQGKKILSGEYDWINPDLQNKSIYFFKDGLSGFYDLKTQRTITRKGIYGVTSIPSPLKNVKFARLTLFYSEEGSEVLDPEFKTLFTTKEFIHTWSWKDSTDFDDIVYKFGVPNSNRTGYLDANGKVVVPDIYTHYYSPADHLSTFGDNKCFIATDGKKFDFYPGFGEEPIRGYQYLHFADHYLTAKIDNSWMLLDEELNVVFTDSKYGLSFLSGHFDPIDFNYENMYQEGSQFFAYHLFKRLDPQFNFIYQIDFGKPLKECHGWSNCIDKPGKVGLTNIRSKKSIPVEYEYILPLRNKTNEPYRSLKFHQEAPNYFWAISTNRATSKLYLTIYNDNLEKEKSYTLNERSLDFLRFDRRNLGDSMTKILVNEKGLYGMIRADGSTKIPFQYKRLRYHHPHGHNQIEHLYFGNDTHYGLFDAQGNMLLPVIYDTIYYPNPFHYDFLVGKKDGKYTFYLNQTGEQMNQISHIFEAEYIQTPNEIGDFYYRKSNYFIKDGFLYVIDKNEFVLMDERRVYIKQEKKELFRQKLVIDRSGKVLKNEMY